MKIKLNFLRSFFSRPAEVMPVLTERGVLLCIQRPSGTFESREVIVAPNAGKGSPWYLGKPFNIDVQGGTLNISVESQSVVLYEGTPAECKSLSTVIRQAWLEANQGGGFASAPRQRRAPYAPAPMQSYVPQMSLGRRGGPVRWVFGTLLALTVAFVGAAGMNVYLQRGGPGLDLSSMSIEDVAALDSNPVAVRKLQDQMTVAMQVGQEQGKKLSGKIEEDHLNALKAMGLQPGVSVKNAMACLATK